MITKQGGKMEDVLKEIREAEKKAKRIIEDAEKERAEIVSRARHDSLRKINEEQERINNEKDARIKIKAKELEAVKSRIRDKGREEAEKIEKMAKQNMQKTEDFILKKFEEKINRK